MDNRNFHSFIVHTAQVVGTASVLWLDSTSISAGIPKAAWRSTDFDSKYFFELQRKETYAICDHLVSILARYQERGRKILGWLGTILVNIYRTRS